MSYQRGYMYYFDSGDSRFLLQLNKHLSKYRNQKHPQLSLLLVVMCSNQLISASTSASNSASGQTAPTMPRCNSDPHKMKMQSWLHSTISISHPLIHSSGVSPHFPHTLTSVDLRSRPIICPLSPLNFQISSPQNIKLTPLVKPPVVRK